MNDPTVLLIYSFRPPELICQFYKLKVSVLIMKKDAWEQHHLGMWAFPFAVTMKWEAQAGIKREVPPEASLVSTELKP